NRSIGSRACNISASERLSLGKKRRNSPFSTSQRVTASSMDHKNFCPCSAALIASTCAEPIPFVGTSAARVATLDAATGAAVGATVAALVGAVAGGETETLAGTVAGPRPFPDSTSRLESDVAGFAVEAGGIAGETPTALADEFPEEFVTGAMRTAAPEEDTGWDAV